VGRYLARRLLIAIPTVFGLSLLVFALISLAPGDPAEELARRSAPGGEVTPEDVERARRELGLERPFLVQYGQWLKGAAQGDLGVSFARRTPVRDEISQHLRATAELAGAAFLLTLCLALPLGTAAALRYRRLTDHLLRLFALVGASIPVFFLAYVLIGVFATRLGLLPVAGRQGLHSLVLPAVSVALLPTALVSRLLRSSLLEVLGEDYMRTARGKGLSPLHVVVVHALRNAAVPVVTVLGWIFGNLLEGAVVAEVIFAWPGLGQLTYEAIAQRDYPMVQGLVVLAGVVYVVVNLLVDLSYSILDARVRLQEAG
jgi:peptide/nickel transport system permease protein